MSSSKRAIFAPVALVAFLGWTPAPQQAPEGFPIENQRVVDRCSRCHTVDDDGRMSRISYLRKTPEGWQTSIRRMVSLHGVRLDANDAREIARYLADEQGLAPDELRPGLFEVERRMIEHDYEGDSEVEFTCIKCHSMGRVITQRRTKDEWGLLLATHRGLYPLVDGHAFRRRGAAPSTGDRRHPMDVAIDHLSETFPLETPEWSAWSATKRPPRIAGTWALSGYEPGRGSLYGTVTITADPADPASFVTSTSYTYAETGERMRRSGRGLVYTGYQWRGRSNPDSEDELREVMLIERDQGEMSGRWFSGAYSEVGPDVTLRRTDGRVVVSGVYPKAVERGGSVEVQVFGASLVGGSPADLDFGAGVSVTSVEGPRDGAVRVRITISPDAPVGARDLFAFGNLVEGAIVVHDGVDRIEVTPRSGMARLGGEHFPKGFQVFEAIGYDDGPDGRAGTGDDLDLGRVDVSWEVEEYAAVLGDNDVDYVGTMGRDGRFIPAADGPNPSRAGDRNNVGDVWVVATHRRADGAELSARAHLVVTVPLYMRFEPWREVDSRRTLGAGS